MTPLHKKMSAVRVVLFPLCMGPVGVQQIHVVQNCLSFINMLNNLRVRTYDLDTLTTLLWRYVYLSFPIYFFLLINITSRI